MGSYAAKIAVFLATIAAIAFPWVLAGRCRFAPGRTTAVFLAAIAAQVLIMWLGRESIQMSSDYWNGGMRGVVMVSVSMTALAAAIVVQIGVLIGRAAFALAAKQRRRTPSSIG